MQHYEQMELDVMLEGERDLKENIGVAVDFACRQLESQGLAAIASRQEGYGIAMQYYNSMAKSQKAAADAMKNFLQILPSGDSEAIFAASKLFDAANDIAYEAVLVASQANRIRTDLYRKTEEKEQELTPMEEYLESLDEGFEETGEQEEDNAGN